jgi:hypothetical protein
VGIVSVPDPVEFLRAVSGFTRAETRMPPRVKLGTIDPAYSSASYPGALPKVTFDGESTLSGKRYTVVGSYLPTPGDRVALLPAGKTYVIIGAIDADAAVRVGGALSVGGILSLGGGDDLDTGDWSSYTPTWTASSSNPTIVAGAGSSARYRYADKNTVHVQILTFFDTGSAKGSGTYKISLPVTGTEAPLGGAVGAAIVNDSGAAVRPCIVTGASTSTVNIWTAAGNILTDAVLTGTFVGSWVRIDFTYQV